MTNIPKRELSSMTTEDPEITIELYRKGNKAMPTGVYKFELLHSGITHSLLLYDGRTQIYLMIRFESLERLAYDIEVVKGWSACKEWKAIQEEGAV
jgi:hypothetical protein